VYGKKKQQLELSYNRLVSNWRTELAGNGDDNLSGLELGRGTVKGGITKPCISKSLINAHTHC
jgi:hypothetical protein